MCITDGRWARADLFDTVLRQHLIKDANISRRVAKRESNEDLASPGRKPIGRLVRLFLGSRYNLKNVERPRYIDGIKALTVRYRQEHFSTCRLNASDTGFGDGSVTTSTVYCRKKIARKLYNFDQSRSEMRAPLIFEEKSTTNSPIVRFVCFGNCRS